MSAEDICAIQRVCSAEYPDFSKRSNIFQWQLLKVCLGIFVPETVILNIKMERGNIYTWSDRTQG